MSLSKLSGQPAGVHGCNRDALSFCRCMLFALVVVAMQLSTEARMSSYISNLNIGSSENDFSVQKRTKMS
jgi:hypothetical protein